MKKWILAGILEPSIPAFLHACWSFFPDYQRWNPTLCVPPVPAPVRGDLEPPSPHSQALQTSGLGSQTMTMSTE